MSKYIGKYMNRYNKHMGRYTNRDIDEDII